ncbi:MAG: hypothetical protein K5694_04350 [Bacilli bacterium]|nr:hypothetical protein [Bacilli bacterium]
MKKSNKLAVSLLGFSFLLLPSCGKGNAVTLDWGNIEEYKASVRLDATHAVSGDKLSINVDMSDGYLKNVTKERIIVKEKVSVEGAEKKEMSSEDLLKNAITNYELKVTESKLTITLPTHNEGRYFVLFHKESTKDNKFAYADVNLSVPEIYSVQPFVSAVEDRYIVGETNQVFEATFGGSLTVDDVTKVSFGKAFNGLTLDKCLIEDKHIYVYSAGEVGNEEEGSLILEPGFFKEADYPIELFYNVVPLAVYPDNSSFAIEGGEFTFRLLANSDLELEKLGKMYLGEYPVSRFELLDGESYIAKFYIPFEGSLDEAIETFAGQTLSFQAEDASLHSEQSVLSVNFPHFDLYHELIENTFTLHFRYSDVVVGEISQDMIEIESQEIVLKGGGKNAEIKSFTPVDNGFDMVIETSAEHEKISGLFSFNAPDGLFKCIWGTNFEGPEMLFECEKEDETPGSTSGAAIDETFAKKVIEAKPEVVKKDQENAGTLIFAAAYLAQLGISLNNGNAYNGINSVLNLMKLFGISSGGTSMKDVMNKLNDISNQLKVLDRKIDALKQQISTGQAVTQLGIDRILFNQYRNSWDNFYQNYIEKMEDTLRDYAADIHSYFINFAKNSGDLTLKLHYFTHDEKEVLSMEDPNGPGYSIEGDKLARIEEIQITKSYFQEAADIARASQGYTKKFDEVFQKCLKENLSNNYPSMSSEALDTLSKDCYSHLVGLAQFEAVDSEMAKKMANLFINFANKIAGIGSIAPKMSDYFKMVESLYNFQTEAENELKAFRTNVKLLLDKFAGFATSMSIFCPGFDKSEITNAYNEAYKYIYGNTNLRDISANENYSYIMGRRVAGRVVRYDYNFYYDPRPVVNLAFSIMDEATGYHFSAEDMSSMVNEMELNTIYNRALNILKTMGKDVTAIDYYEYLKTNRLITVKNDDAAYKGHEVLVSYGGLSDALSTTDFTVTCEKTYEGDYFGVGQTYHYRGNHSSDCWRGKEMVGGIYNLDNRGLSANYVNHFAQYQESHWYWFNDENHVFMQDGSDARLLMFYKK